MESAGEDGSRNVRIFLNEISLDHDVAVLKRAQAEPVGVCLPLGLRMMSHVQLAVLLEVRPQVTELALLLDLLVLKWLLPGPLDVFIVDPFDKLLRRFQRLAGRDASFLPKTTEHAVHRTARRLSSHEPSVILRVPLSQVHLWACEGFRKSPQVIPHPLPRRLSVRGAAPPTVACHTTLQVHLAQRLHVQVLLRVDLARALVCFQGSQALAPRREEQSATRVLDVLALLRFPDPLEIDVVRPLENLEKAVSPTPCTWSCRRAWGFSPFLFDGLHVSLLLEVPEARETSLVCQNRFINSNSSGRVASLLLPRGWNPYAPSASASSGARSDLSLATRLLTPTKCSGWTPRSSALRLAVTFEGPSPSNAAAVRIV